MDVNKYKEKIIKMIKAINDKKYLEYIYKLLKTMKD